MEIELVGADEGADPFACGVELYTCGYSPPRPGSPLPWGSAAGTLIDGRAFTAEGPIECSPAGVATIHAARYKISPSGD